MQVWVDEHTFEVEVALAGGHNLMNALAAIAAAWAMRCPVEQIQRGLASVRPVKGRLCGLQSPAGLRLIDDTYNANPDSVAAAIQVLRQASGSHWLVLGDLAELGKESESLHAEIGRRARQAGLSHLYSLGRLSRLAAESFGEGAAAFEEVEALVAALKSRAGAGDTLLIKGSRSAAMERVVAALMEAGRG
jgi:UDP-N-acetylmuramoyl-tripeptide--D-alanyl-D-alanine ligase